MQLVECGGVYLPSGETHLVKWMKERNQVVDGKLTYQYHKLEAAIALCKQRHGLHYELEGAVDVGAHCGLWSMHLVKHFQFVHAFEPVAAHRDCFRLNVHADWVTLHAMALGEKDGSVSMHTAPSSSGDTTVHGKGDIPLRRLDDVLPDVTDVDFIKLDCEGYELFALRGGEQLLKRCRPVICVEQKPGKGQQFGLSEIAAVEYLQGLGAKLIKEIGGDYFLSW